MRDSLAEELKQFRMGFGAITGWIFAGERRLDQPMDRHLFDKWLHVAERKAKLPKLEGGLWHPYRRKWATERKHHSLKDVAVAGGWKDTETLLTCHQQPDADTLLAVWSAPNSRPTTSPAPFSVRARTMSGVPGRPDSHTTS